MNVAAVVWSEPGVESSRERLARRFFRVMTALLPGLAESVRLRKVALGILVGRNGHTDGIYYQSARFRRGDFNHTGEHHFAVMEMLRCDPVSFRFPAFMIF